MCTGGACTFPDPIDNRFPLPCLLRVAACCPLLCRVLSCGPCLVCDCYRIARVMVRLVCGMPCCAVHMAVTSPLWRQGVFKLPQPGDGQSGVEASCGAALKDVLIRVFRHSNSELFKPWRQQLLQALEAMGASAAAASVNRHLDRQAARWEGPTGNRGAWRRRRGLHRALVHSGTLSVLVTLHDKENKSYWLLVECDT